MIRRHVAFAGLLNLLLAPLLSATDTEERARWIGQAVLVKTTTVRLRKEPDDQSREVEKSVEAIWIDVTEVEAGWLRIGGGWVHHDDVVRKPEAIEHFTTEIERSPSSFTHACRCRAWTDNKEYEKALTDANVAIQIDATYAPAYFARARAWEDQESFTHALADLNECLRLDSAHRAAYLVRCDIHARQGNYDQAIREIQDALMQTPHDPFLLACIGTIVAEKRDVEHALGDVPGAPRPPTRRLRRRPF